MPSTPTDPEVIQREQEAQHGLEERCRLLFERLRPTLRETDPNWFIAIDPDTENYFLDPTLRGLTVKISQTRKGDTIPMIFRLNDTGNLWQDMIAGKFGEDGELLFEVQLVPALGAPFTVTSLFDTGFTYGWLAPLLSATQE